MAKKVILALIILILIILAGVLFFFNDSVDVYIDGENVTVETVSLPTVEKSDLSNDICQYTLEVMNDTTTDIAAYRNGVNDICSKYGMDDAKITIDSSIGPDQIPIIVNVEGTSMLPTLQDGQTALVNKTHNIHVGDIVVADSAEYGGIIKRVDQINGNDVHLVSDNKNVSYELINGELYRVEGVSTWVDISDVTGVVIRY